MRAHEADSCQKMYICALLSDCFVEHEKFLVANHFSVDHISEGKSADEESDQVSYMLSEKVENHSINGAIGRAPDFGKNVGHCDEYAIRWHHHNAANYIDH